MTRDLWGTKSSLLCLCQFCVPFLPYLCFFEGFCFLKRKPVGNYFSFCPEPSLQTSLPLSLCFIAGLSLIRRVCDKLCSSRSCLFQCSSWGSDQRCLSRCPSWGSDRHCLFQCLSWGSHHCRCLSGVRPGAAIGAVCPGGEGTSDSQAAVLLVCRHRTGSHLCRAWVGRDVCPKAASLRLVFVLLAERNVRARPSSYSA